MNAPPPPPHSSNTGNRNGLPEGSYDIFIVPPHSSGGGFVYFPSLQTKRNSFLAGVASTLVALGIWSIIIPALKEWTSSIMAGGGVSIILLLLAVGVAGWAWGKTQLEAAAGSGGGSAGASSRPNFTGHTTGGPDPGFAAPPPQQQRPPPTWQRSTGAANGTANAGAAKGGWEKAREETRKKEEERKKAEELRKKREEDEKERVRQREKDARERLARERREQETAKPTRPASPNKGHRHPTAKTATDDASQYSYRPYDNPNRPGAKPNSASSIYSESSFAPSHSTSRTTPSPSHRGPYRSKDPDKIIIKAVYSFNSVFTKVPIAKLVSGMGSVTDGLILRITTEGLFIDDDVRGVPQREWDIKAWTLKLVEVWCPHLHALGASFGSIPTSRNAAVSSGMLGLRNSSKAPSIKDSESFLEATQRACQPHLSPFRSKSDKGISSQSGQFKGLHILRASIRDAEGKRYIFVLPEEEGWKVAIGLQRLRRGTQVRALGVSGMPVNETKAILENMGWL